MNAFHLLRPEWLLALIPLMLLLWQLQSRRRRSGNLDAVCDPRLLPYLLIGARDKPGFNHNLLIAIGGLLAITALAGPSWNKVEQPLYRQQSSLVILLDLSSSMNSTDIEPSRLTIARFKLRDILKRRSEGQTALIAYAAQPFVVTPLTDDTATIGSMVGSLTTEIMPSQGSRPDLALQLGVKLLRQSGAGEGDLLLLTDGIGERALREALSSQPPQYRINALGIGTAEGSPIPLAEGGFVQNSSGSIVIDRLDEQRLIELTREGGGMYGRLTPDDRDIDYLLTAMATDHADENSAETNLSSDIWQEEGPWLLLPLLALAALAFRRGYLVLVLLMVPIPQPVHAIGWSDLWLRSDQQAARTLEAGDPEQAARLFQDNRWRSAAHYRAGEYQQSLEALHNIDDADSNYNRGNALARLGRLQEAIEAYQKSLSLKPGDEDTEYNLELVKKLMEQQQQESQSSEQNQQAQNSENEAQQQAGDGSQQMEQHNSNAQASGEPQQQMQPERNRSDEATMHSQREENTTEDRSESSSSETDEEKEQQSESSGSEADEEKKQQHRSQTAAVDQLDDTERAQEESTRQWLRRIPDDPGGLLKRKFRYQYQQQYQGRSENQPW